MSCVIALGLDDAVGELRDRDADVARPGAAAGPERQRGEVRVVARVPQPLAFFEVRRPLEPAAAALGGKRLDGCRLLGDVPLIVAVELEQQRRRDRVAGLRVAVERVHVQVVEQLDAGDRHAELNRRDDGVDRAPERFEGADGRGDRFGSGMEPERHLGDDAERPFGSDEEPRQVVAGRRLARPRAGGDDRVRRRGRPSTRARSRASCRSGRRSCRTRASPPCRRWSRRRPGSIGNMRPVLRSALFELQPRDAGFDRDVEILGADAEDPVHLAEIDRDPARIAPDVALERRAGAERHDRQLVARR